MKIRSAVMALAMMGSAATAQDFYTGLTLDYASPHSGDSQTLSSIVAGLGTGSGKVAYGGELELGYHFVGDAEYDTKRLRGWGTYDLGSVKAMGSLGFTRYDFANSDETGYNIGLGVQRDMSARWALRGEFIRDFMDGDVPDTTTTRIGGLFKF